MPFVVRLSRRDCVVQNRACIVFDTIWRREGAKWRQRAVSWSTKIRSSADNIDRTSARAVVMGNWATRLERFNGIFVPGKVRNAIQMCGQVNTLCTFVKIPFIDARRVHPRGCCVSRRTKCITFLPNNQLQLNALATSTYGRSLPSSLATRPHHCQHRELNTHTGTRTTQSLLCAAAR